MALEGACGGCGARADVAGLGLLGFGRGEDCWEDEIGEKFDRNEYGIVDFVIRKAISSL